MPDIVIIGAGHNGLVDRVLPGEGRAQAARARAAAARRRLRDERGVRAGLPRAPTLAHTLGPLRPSIVRDMQLERRGVSSFVPIRGCRARRPTAARSSSRPTRRGPRRRSGRSRRKTRRVPGVLRARSSGSAAFLSDLLEMTPPSIDAPSTGELWDLLKTGRRFRALGKKDRFALLRWGPMAVADLVAEWFETDLLQAAVAARGDSRHRAWDRGPPAPARCCCWRRRSIRCPAAAA